MKKTLSRRRFVNSVATGAAEAAVLTTLPVEAGTPPPAAEPPMVKAVRPFD